MNHKMVSYACSLCLMAIFSVPTLALADTQFNGDSPGMGNNECPVGLVSGLTLDQEFGPGASAITHCVQKRHDVRVLFQIDRFCGDPTKSNAMCTGPYALGNMDNAVNDYEITDGMVRGRDYKMIAVVYGSGGLMLRKGNKFESKVKALMAEGVKFYFCQNTVRGFIKAGLLPNFSTSGQPAASGLIDGVEYVTAGVTSVLDYEARGWSVIAP